MSTTEMKLKAFEDLSKLNKPEAIEEIYIHLQKLNEKQKVYNLSQHFDSLEKEFGDVMQKLAQ